MSHAWLWSFRGPRRAAPYPISIPERCPRRPPRGPPPLVELGRFELPTSRVQGGRSPTKLQPQGRSRLALGPRVGVPGIEPGTSVLSGLRSNRLSYTPVRAAPGGP